MPKSLRIALLIRLEINIFPGTGNEDYPKKNVYNFPLVPRNADLNSRGKGDDALRYGVEQFIDKIDAFKPDLIFITCGADGHKDDPLSSLEYSVEGYAGIAQQLRQHHPDMPMLFGGAGGYLPDTRTPEVWGRFASVLIIKNALINV